LAQKRQRRPWSPQPLGKIQLSTLRLHFLTDLDLSKNAIGAIRGLYGSLGLDATFTPTAQRHRHNEGIYSLRRLRWLQQRMHLMWQKDDRGRWYTTRPTQPLPALANAVCAGIDRYVLARIERPTSLNVEPCLHRALRENYDSDVAKLQELLHTDLSGWRT
jgi:hypothetical protein